MDTVKREIPWDTMLKFFISKLSITLKDVADQYRVNLNTVLSHAAKNDWSQFKNAYFQSHKDFEKLVEQEIEIAHVIIKGQLCSDQLRLELAMRSHSPDCEDPLTCDDLGCVDEESVDKIVERIKNSFKMLDQVQESNKRLKNVKDKNKSYIEKWMDDRLTNQEKE